MNDISIDIETLGTNQDSVIMSIGACYFDRLSGDIASDFYVNVELENQPRPICMKTLRWWIGQSEEAAAHLFKEEQPLDIALHSLKLFIDSKACVWGNGANFDLGILENAYGGSDKTPWPFWSTRDMRTVVDIASYTKGMIPFEGAQHNALDDAKHQAKVIAHCISQVTNHGIPF